MSTLKGKKEEEKEEKDRHYHSEGYGEFQRSLLVSLDRDEIRAGMKDGVLNDVAGS